MVYLGYNDIKLSLDPDGADLADGDGRLSACSSIGSSMPVPPAARAASSWSCRTTGAAARATLRTSIRSVRRHARSAPRSGTPFWPSSRQVSPTPGWSRSTCSPPWSACSEQPADFGFTNVTDKRPQGADPAKYLLRPERRHPLRPARPGADPPGGPVLPDPGLGLVQHLQGPGNRAAEAGRGPRGREGVRRRPLRPALDGRRGELTGIALSTPRGASRLGGAHVSAACDQIWRAQCQEA